MKPFLQQLLLVTLYVILIVQGRRSAQAAGPLVSMEPVPAPTAPAIQASGHPDLRVPAGKRAWPAARPPLWQPVLAAFDEPQAIMEYDPGQRREFTRAMALADTAAAGADSAAPPFEGLLPQPITPETVIGADDRVRVWDTTTYPWRTLCKLFITAADGTQWIGSGTIIGRADGNGFHVLTAGHCVYIHDHGGWAASIEVVPGYDDGYMPFNNAWATYYRSYTGWTSSASPDHDWAVLTLDRRVGNFTGWMGRITRGSSDPLYHGILNSAGYPGDLCSGNCQYFDSDTGVSASEYKHFYNMDTAGGQSGMPVWMYITSGTDPAPGRYIATVHAYGSGGSGNSGTRLNADKFDRINTWLNEDAAPADRADLLDDGDGYSWFSPASVIPGSTSFTVQCRVRNIGTAASGPFTVRFHASWNTTISALDAVIAESAQGSLGAFSYRTLTVTVPFPAGIPAGNYYVGWVVDADGVVVEFSEGNNTACITSSILTVSAPARPDIAITPTSLQFTSGAAAAAGGAEAAGPAKVIPAPALAPAVAPEQKLVDGPQILQEFVRQPRARVVVNLNPPAEARARGVNFHAADDVRAWRSAVAALQRDVTGRVPGRDLSVRHRFANLAAFSAEVSWAGLQALLADPQVASIEPVYELEAHLAQGLPLIGGLTHRARFDGTGSAIAICDTGVDYNHPRLGGGGFPNSKVIGGYDFGDGDADPAPNGHGHGTACAGIAAGGLGSNGDYIGGVAPGAKIYALKISAGTTGSATSDAMVAAWDWCVTHRNDDPNNPIVAISTSFGGGRYSSACDAAVPSMTAAVNNAIAAGITVLASSGNNGYCDSLAWPACIPGVISVGAVYDGGFGTYLPCVDAASCAPKTAGGCASGYYATDVTAADKVTSYCNISSALTLLAPGNRCSTLDITSAGGYSSGDYTDTFGGTSAACPYAAGAVAGLQMAAKALTGRFLTVAEVRSKLLATGDNVTDTKVAITKPRVNLARAIDSLGSASPGQTFRIANTGNATLQVHAITPETAAPWITITPTGPFQVAPGTGQDVTVTVNPALAPGGASSVRLLVTSDDPDESPYPNAVYVAVTPPAPANDHFAQASRLAGRTGIDSGSTTGASREAGEPFLAGNAGGHSVWWSWTAPADGIVEVTTDGSSFDTLLGVYTGNSLGSLTRVIDDDDSGAGLNSLVRFAARAGTEYQVAVDGYNGASGDYRLTLQLLAPVRLRPPQVLADGTRRLCVTTADGQPLEQARATRLQVLVSTDPTRPVAQWTPLASTMSYVDGQCYFDDPGAGAVPARFYMLMEQP